MLDWARRLPPSSAQLLCILGADFGVPGELLLAETPFTLEDLRHGEILVSGVEEMSIVRALLRELPRIEHLGLLAGQAYHLTSHGLMGFAGASADTGREAFRVVQRFLPLTWALCQQRHSDDGTLYSISFDASLLPAELRAFFVQRELASTVQQSRDVAGEVGQGFAVHTWFQQRAPMDREAQDAFLRLLGTPPRFASTQNRLAVDSALLDVPLPHSNPVVFEQMVAASEKALATLRSQERTTVRVVTAIRARLAQGAPLEAVAHDLNVSARTLRRRLAAEHETYRDLVDTTRRRRAEDLLLNTDLGVGEIASQVGYENLSAFTTAFRRWQGMPPSGFRKHGR